MANPSGTNQFGGFTREAPYGSERELTTLTSAAPLPQTPALGAPRRAQKRATRPIASGRPAELAVPAPTPATPALQLAAPILYAGLWRQIAMEPGASELVKTMAQQAIQEASLG